MRVRYIINIKPKNINDNKHYFTANFWLLILIMSIFGNVEKYKNNANLSLAFFSYLTLTIAFSNIVLAIQHLTKLFFIKYLNILEYKKQYNS